MELAHNIFWVDAINAMAHALRLLVMVTIRISTASIWHGRRRRSAGPDNAAPKGADAFGFGYRVKYHAVYRRCEGCVGSALAPAGRDDRAIEVRAGHGTVVGRVAEGVDVAQRVGDPIAAVVRRDKDG
jgi:hypothetical protein